VAIANALQLEAARAMLALCHCMVCIRLTISSQCDMVVSPVVWHSGHSAFRHGTGQTDRASDVYV